MNEVEIKTRKKRQANPDRIVLNKDSMETILRMVSQVEQAFGGMVKLGTKDIANFLIHSRGVDLDTGELAQIREKYFDEVRAAQWALDKLKQAKDAGRPLTLAEVLLQLQGPNTKRQSKERLSKRPPKTNSNSPNNAANFDSKKADSTNDEQLND